MCKYMFRIQYENDREIKSLLTPMLDLHTLKIVGECSEDLLTFILSFCLNVKYVSLGMSTKISDQVLQNVLVNNRLAKLETLSIQKSGQDLTMKGIELIMENCDNLKFFKDPTCFGGVHENEVKILKLKIKEENLDLLLEEEPVKVRDPSGPGSRPVI